MRHAHAARLLALVLAAAGAGCASQSTAYRWGDYEGALYRNYRNPEQHQQYVASLKTVILSSERAGTKIPPGIYAEYGYALYEEGSAELAVAYYQREIDAWPASEAFMRKMIDAAQRQPRPGPKDGPKPTGPATAVEKATGS